MMVSLINSHTNATRLGWHIRETDWQFASGLPSGWVQRLSIEWDLVDHRAAVPGVKVVCYHQPSAFIRPDRRIHDSLWELDRSRQIPVTTAPIPTQIGSPKILNLVSPWDHFSSALPTFEPAGATCHLCRTRLARPFSSRHAGSAVQIRQLWSGKASELASEMGEPTKTQTKLDVVRSGSTL